METRYFLWDMDARTFVAVTEGMTEDWPKWSNGNCIIAKRPTTDAYWQFDVHFGGAFAEEVYGLAEITRLYNNTK